MWLAAEGVSVSELFSATVVNRLAVDQQLLTSSGISVAQAVAIAPVVISTKVSHELQGKSRCQKPPLGNLWLAYSGAYTHSLQTTTMVFSLRSNV